MNAQPPSPTEKAESKAPCHVYLPFVVTFLAVSIVITALGFQRNADFRARHVDISVAATQRTAAEIALLMAEKRRLTRLFAEDEQALINALAQDPENEALRNHLNQRIERSFPDFFAMMLAQADGKPILDDFDGFVGEMCLADLREHALGHEKVRLHPNPLAYHFDLIVPWQGQEQAGILLISYHVQIIARSLEITQPNQHHFLLMSAEQPPQIAISALGGRNRLLDRATFTLSQQEQARILSSHPVQGTLWHLIDLHDPSLFLQHSQKTITLLGSLFALFLFVFGLSLAYVVRAERHRSRMEQVVKEERAQAQTALTTLHETQEQLVEQAKMAALGRLVAGVAHELNTPIGIALTAISHLQGNTQKVEQAIAQASLKKSTLHRHVATCQKSCELSISSLQRAGDLVRAFKEVAVDRTTLNKHRLPLLHYLRTLLTGLQPLITKAGHQFHIEGPENIEFDTFPGPFAQVITHLVSNSLAHAYDPGQNGHLKFKIQLTEQRLFITYTDDGKGIPAQHLKQIFDPFFTTQRGQGGQGGSGLGLHITYNLVTHILNGCIRCQSEIHQGTSFFIEIPV